VIGAWGLIGLGGAEFRLPSNFTHPNMRPLGIC
jgi:hypothetical protein